MLHEKILGDTKELPMSAKKAIRLMCKWCCLNSNIEVTRCPSTDCAIWPFREGDTIKGESKQKAIRIKCTDCLQTIFTGKCKEKKCQLFMYRDGHRPVAEGHVKKVLTAEQAEKFNAYRAKKRKPSSESSSSEVPIVIKPKRRLIGCTEKLILKGSL